MPGNKPIENKIDLQSLCSRPAYLLDIEQFLVESDPIKSLSYWLTEFGSIQNIKNTDDIIFAIQRSIADIDHLLNDQLNAIIHDKKFQTLEASWRGLYYLAEQSEGIKNIKIRVLDITWAEVTRDISRALEFDQSQLFKKIYSEEYGTPGGEPYGVLIGDYEICHKPGYRHGHDDIATLRGISQISAAAFSPFIASAAPELFGLDDFVELTQAIDLQNIFSQTEYIKWRAFRETPDAQFVGLTLPHILMRKPYRKTAGSYKGLFFQEATIHQGLDAHCWGSAAFAFAAILLREFASVGWFGHIRGVLRNQVGGGLLTNLTSDSFDTDSSEIAFKPVTNIIITDARERELGDLGLIPLCQCYNTSFAAFYGNQSLRNPQNMGNSAASINARLSAMLQHVLCGSRIAHYIKVIIRDKIGSFLTAEECENFLRDWLFKYTTGREDLDWEEQARYPLRESLVTVNDHPEKPGEFTCVIRLRPHYQLDHMVSELELVTELAQSA